MRILAVGDMHGNLEKVRKAITGFPADLLLCCGDWGDPEEIDRRVFSRILEAIPVMSVYGNHDDLDLLSRARNTDGTPVLMAPGEVYERGGLRFAGISGIWAKSHRKPYYVTDEDVAGMAAKLAGREIDVLLSHGCAIGLADATPAGGRGGHRCFLNAFHAIDPRLYLCGHLHVPQQRVLKDGRIIVNVGFACEGDCWVFSIDDTIEFSHKRI
jgi:Icc-related predicted phosphoesterase